MNNSPKFEAYGPIETITDLTPMRASFSLANNLNMEHFVGKSTGRQYLNLGEETTYPDHGISASVEELILPPAFVLGANKDRWLLLPDNFVTMAQALNDAIGDQATDYSHELAHDLFAELGAQLAQLAATDKVLPKHLTHKQVIFLRNESGVKLTPPLELEEFEDAREARERCLREFQASCVKSTATLVQLQQVLEAFQGFEDSFVWE